MPYFETRCGAGGVAGHPRVHHSAVRRSLRAARVDHAARHPAQPVLRGAVVAGVGLVQLRGAGRAGRAAEVSRARFMTGGGYRLLASANFGELVLGCIEAKFCKYILVGKLSPRSTQCTPLHSSAISIFCKNCQKFR